LTTALEVAATDAERLALFEKAQIEPKKQASQQVAKRITLQLLQIDLKSGSIIRSSDLMQIDDPDPIHSLNSYASPTPVIDGPHLYCHFGTYGTFCFRRDDLSKVWERRLPLVHSVGPGSSPFVFQDQLVLICDGVDRQYVTALHRLTGETIWEKDRPPMEAPSGDMKKAYNTPIAIVDSKGREQLICVGSQWVVSHDPKSGEELWKIHHGKGFSVVPRPVFGNGLLYFATGFGKPELWAVKVDGSGDVTETHVAWTEKKRIPAKPSPLLVGDLLFVVSDDGIASCFQAATGEVHWSERVGGNYSSSPLLADGKLYIANHEGLTTVLRPSGAFEQLSRNQLDGQIMASPVAVDGALLIRTDKALYRIEEKRP
jgi:hypothetical protein